MCPERRACSSVGSRESSTRRASPSLRESASAHLSTSPGGSTPSSSRSWPELPPLSNMVTTACSLSQGLRFNPPSRLGRPVPPPKQPTFSSRSRIRAIDIRWIRPSGRSAGSVQPCAIQSTDDIRCPTRGRIPGERSSGDRCGPARRLSSSSAPRGRRTRHRDGRARADAGDRRGPAASRISRRARAAWPRGGATGLATPLVVGERRVRPLARRVSDRVRRHPGAPRGRRRRQTLRRAVGRDRRSAPGLRGAGAQPPAAPARGLPRDRRRSGGDPRSGREFGRAAAGAAPQSRARRRRSQRRRPGPLAAFAERAIGPAPALRRRARPRRGTVRRPMRRGCIPAYLAAAERLVAYVDGGARRREAASRAAASAPTRGARRHAACMLAVVACLAGRRARARRVSCQPLPTARQRFRRRDRRRTRRAGSTAISASSRRRRATPCSSPR